MPELIIPIISFVSFLIILAIIFLKIPVLVKLPEVETRKRKGNFIVLYRNLAKKNKFFNLSFYEVFLEKTLSRFRVLTLKIDNKTCDWLQRVRENSKDRKK